MYSTLMKLGIFFAGIGLVASCYTYFNYRNWDYVDILSYEDYNCKTEQKMISHTLVEETVCSTIITYNYKDKTYNIPLYEYKGVKTQWRVVNPENPEQTQEILTNILVSIFLILLGSGTAIYAGMKKRKRDSLNNVSLI